jgi:O-antigen ligase
MQRSLTFLPIKVHPMARQDAQGTLEWRLSMWKVVVHDVPQYLWLGKGYIFSSVDLFLIHESIQRGFFELYEETLVTGNYHNGLLTLVVPFGLPGAGAFVFFLFAGWRVLQRNYLYGDPELRNINTFLIAYFAARLVYYIFFYGQFDLDLMVFTGVVGLSVSLNGGVCRPPGPGQQPALAPAHA